MGMEKAKGSRPNGVGNFSACDHCQKRTKKYDGAFRHGKEMEIQREAYGRQKREKLL